MMKNSKRAAVLVLVLVIAFLLTACSNSLRGTYVSEDGYFELALGEDRMTLNNIGQIRTTGTYTVKGDQLLFTYVDPWGDDYTLTYIIKQKGDKLVLEFPNGVGEETFVRTDGGKNGGSAGTVILVVAVIAALAAGAVLLKKKGGTTQVRRPSKEEVKKTVQRASKTAAEAGSRAAKTVAASAAEVSSRAAKKAQDISSTAALASAKAAQQPAQQDLVRRIPLSPDTCCICGRPLSDGAITLGGLPEGKKAWIDQSCVEKLQALGQPESEESFEKAARFMKGQVKYLDPDVGVALRRFVQKAEDRFYFN